MTRPAISVVVPTHGRPAGLAALLAGVERQSLTRDQYELIVVDDASDPPAVAPGADHLIRHERPRVSAAARNIGWRAASAAVVAFLDDDCVPVPGWLAAITAAADDDRAV